MQAQLNKILEEAKAQLQQAGSVSDVDDVRVKLLGKKGKLTEILRGMGKLSPEERKSTGQMANSVRSEIEGLLERRFADMKAAAKEAKFKLEKIDVTEPGKDVTLGVKHPLTITIEEISKVFMSMGFSIAEGPEVETVFNNFDALNAGPNHPSRDMSDTFYITEDIAAADADIACTGKNADEDEASDQGDFSGKMLPLRYAGCTHSPMFHQIEGLVVDEGITMADLKGTLDSFAKQLFGTKTKTKFRPHHFPFTEPSAEMDVSCFKCGGKGCRVCKGSGWIEILGCGMVHPHVLKVGGLDTEKYTGFAFGMGVERAADAEIRC